ncbi:MAG: DUF2920 family protein [Candidatus Saccharibacteria bacterium]
MNLAEGLTIEIEGHPTEFGYTRKFNMFIKGPRSGIDANTGILLVVHNKGQEAGHEFFQALRREWADRYNVLVVGVDYLGTHSCSNPAWRLQISPYSINKLVSMMPEEIRPTDLENVEIDIQALLRSYEDSGIEKIEEGFLVFNDSYSGSEYWDFGLIQAMDIIYAYRVALEICRQNDLFINERRSFIYGYGEGGHIAQMCGRLAPNTFSLIADMGGPVFASPQQMVPFEARFFVNEKLPLYNIIAPLVFVQLYTLDKNSEFVLTQDMVQIRNLTRFIPKTNCQYVMFSHPEDVVTTQIGRDYLVERMNEAGINVVHYSLKNEGDEDDEYGVNVVKIFQDNCDQYLIPDSSEAVQRQGESDFTLQSHISLKTSNGQYVLDYSDFVPQLAYEGSIVRLRKDDV